MSKKGENIYKRKDGRWEGRYQKGCSFDGKKKFGYVYGKTYHEVKSKLLVQKADMIRGEASASTGHKKIFFCFCDDWLYLNKARIKESTYLKYYNIIHNYIKPKLGMLLPQEIDDFKIQEFTEMLLSSGSLKYAKGLSPKTVRDILCILRAILKYARKSLGNDVPTVEVTYPQIYNKEIRVLTVSEQEILVNYLKEHMDNFKFGVLLTLITGMRIGELCALQWGNISITEGIIRIDRTVQRLQLLDCGDSQKTKIKFDTPKSRNSLRKIPLSDQAIQLCLEVGPKPPSAFVLTGQSEVFMEPRSAQYRFSKCIKECGLSGITFHTLRHTFATRCVEVGFEIKSLSEILGHSNVKVTLDKYVHSSLELKRINMNKLSFVTPL